MGNPSSHADCEAIHNTIGGAGEHLSDQAATAEESLRIKISDCARLAARREI
jgi:hypothetical protein